MFRLLDLPGELFEQVIDEFTASSGLPEILRARAVNQLFAETLNYRLLAKTPLSKFSQYWKKIGSQPLNPIEKFFRKHVGRMLFYRAQKSTSANVNLLRFLNTLADELMLHAPTTVLDDGEAKAALRTTYLHALSHTYAKINLNNHNALYPSNLVLAFETRRRTHWDTKDADWWNVNDEDRLAAAATVGNVSAVQHFLTKNGDVVTHPTSGRLGTQFVALRSVASPKCYDYFFPERKLFGDLFHTSINAAANFQSASAAILLVEFAEEQDVGPRGFRKRNQALLVRAARSGCVDLVKYLMERDERWKGNTVYIGELADAVFDACRLGRVEVMRYLLDAEHIFASPSFPPSSTCIKPSKLFPWIDTKSKYDEYTPIEVAITQTCQQSSYKQALD